MLSKGAQNWYDFGPKFDGFWITFPWKNCPKKRTLSDGQNARVASKSLPLSEKLARGQHEFLKSFSKIFKRKMVVFDNLSKTEGNLCCRQFVRVYDNKLFKTFKDRFRNFSTIFEKPQSPDRSELSRMWKFSQVL